MSRLLQSLYITIVSIGLFALLAAIIPGIDMFEPISRALTDVTITDIHYASMRDAKPVGNDKILIVDTSDSDRAEIADAIENAAKGGASVIGIDVIFSDNDVNPDSTRKLCDILTAHKDKIVTAVHLNKWDKETGAYISTVRTATDSINLPTGYTNLIDHSDNSYIRNYSTAPESATPSFAQAVTEAYMRTYGDSTRHNPTNNGIINFTPQRFKTVDASDIKAIQDLSDGRMVVLGATDSDEDYHFTPIGRLSGVIIQAYSIDSILNDDTIVVADWLTWIIGFIIVFAASSGFTVLRDNFENRNPTANRYTYAILGLGNIMYPTLAIIFTIFLIGMLYITASIYISSLFIAGSLAFIPVAFDLIGISREVFRKKARTTATIAAILLTASSANAANNGSANTASGKFTSVYETHNVTQNGENGLFINVSFDVSGMKGKKGRIVCYFCDEEGKDIPGTEASYQTTSGSLFCRKYFTPSYDNSTYTNVGIFLPHKQIKPNEGMIKYYAILYDDNGNKLDETRWHKFLFYRIASDSPSKGIAKSYAYSTKKFVRGYFKSVNIEHNATENGKNGMYVKLDFEIYGMKGEKGSATCHFYEENKKPLKGRINYRTSDGELCATTRITPSYDSTKYTGLNVFLPYEELQINSGGTHSLKLTASLFDQDNEWVCSSEYFDFKYIPKSTTLANTAKGVVVDSKGEPLIGASVLVADKRFGAATDIDGRFTINNVEIGESLKVSYVGYKTKTVTFTEGEMRVILYETKDSSSRLKTTDSKVTNKTSKPAPNSNTRVSTTAANNTRPGATGGIKFSFRTSDNTKFSDPNFKISFTTNAKSLKYWISGKENDIHIIPANDISKGVHSLILPKHSCKLCIIDEYMKLHTINLIYDEDRDIRKNSTLHILSIGVNNYPATNLTDLKYAENDARDVLNTFVSRHKNTFGNIRQKLLLGQNVTTANIENALEEIADAARSTDLAVIFFAGHGLVDGLDKYYLATSKTIDRDTPRKGSLSATSFIEKIQYISQKCKLVVFVDACSSGRLAEGMRGDQMSNADFFKELVSTKNGTNIYTSSGSDTPSNEDSRYGHGVFTQALIEACDFSNSDTDHDGRITIKEIRNYLEKRIPQLTDKSQTPIHRNLEETTDYPLFVK